MQHVHNDVATQPDTLSTARFGAWLLLACTLLVLQCLSLTPVFAAEAQERIGAVVIAVGDAQAVGKDGSTRDLKRRDAIFQGDTLKTGSRGRLQIRFNDGARLSLRPNTEMDMESYRYEPQRPRRDRVSMRLKRGGFRTVTGNIGKRSRTRYRVNTPYAVIGVRGTDYGASFEEGNGDPFVLMGVNEGTTTLTNDAGQAIVGDEGDFAFAVVNSPDTPPIPVAEPPAGFGAFLNLDLGGTAEDADGGSEGGVSPDSSDGADDGPDEGSDDGSDDAGGGPDQGGEGEADIAEGDAEITDEIATEFGSSEGGEEEDPLFSYDTRCL